MPPSPPTGCTFAVLEAAGAVVLLDTTVYRLNAVKKAAYKFGDRCHVHIEPVEPTRVKVVLKGKKLLENIEFIAGEFCNEVLDQELREVVAAETEPVRNLLLAEAFSKTSLIRPECETADFRDDPCEIRQPDEPHQRAG
jgi:His-Xaa-Ser system protein HxsD